MNVYNFDIFMGLFLCFQAVVIMIMMAYIMHLWGHMNEDEVQIRHLQWELQAYKQGTTVPPRQPDAELVEYLVPDVYNREEQRWERVPTS